MTGTAWAAAAARIAAAARADRIVRRGICRNPLSGVSARAALSTVASRCWTRPKDSAERTGRLRMETFEKNQRIRRPCGLLADPRNVSKRKSRGVEGASEMCAPRHRELRRGRGGG
jgi:hypothetical protein